MKGCTILIGLSLALLALIGTGDAVDLNAETSNCASVLQNACSHSRDQNVDDVTAKCNSVYSGVQEAMQGLQRYVFQHISQSYKYLLLSTVFGSYEKNREGFEKLYRKLSDDSWEDAIEIIKYTTKRGLSVNMRAADSEIQKYKSDVNLDSDINEIQSLSIALDMHKKLAETAHQIHGTVTKRNCHPRDDLLKKDCVHHDPEVASYMEQEFVHKHAKTIRELSGYITDLFDMSHVDSASADPQLELYIFDQYLKKTL